jgi:glycosyltransferase involved in cell wall biosynthesis
VVIPCRNEARYITVCLDSILANDYPRNRLEVLIADGMSEDGTREIIDKYSRLRSEVRCLDNPKRITPSALNIGVANARGEVIIRMDAHARIAGDYIRRCVAGLSRYRVDCVGGVMHTLPQEHTPVGRAIAAALGSGFGVGNSRFRVHPSEPTYVDTVFGACYRREVFERVGLFNERLPRTQDFEFNARLRRGGGRILLLPGIVSYYYVRVGLGRFWGDNFNNGVWAVLPFARSRVVPVSWRHLVPLVFVALLMVSALLAPRSAAARLVLAAVAGAYLAAAASASVLIAWRRREPRFLAVMPVVFSALHVAYGLGSLWGLTKISTASALRVLSGARRAIRHALQPEARGRE